VASGSDTLRADGEEFLGAPYPLPLLREVESGVFEPVAVSAVLVGGVLGEESAHPALRFAGVLDIEAFVDPPDGAEGAAINSSNCTSPPGDATATRR
jgi:hypothetical protein